MKILYVSNLYGDNARGGAERIVELEARAMAAAGHAVTVVRGVRSGHGERNEGGVRVVSYAPSNLFFYADAHKHGLMARFFWHLIDMFNGASAAAFARILEAEQPDVVHTHNLMGLGFMIPARIRLAQRLRARAARASGSAASARPLRHVHTVHDVQLLHPSGLLPQSARSGGFAQSVYVALMRGLMGSPDRVLFPSLFHRALHDRFGFFANSRREVLSNPAPAVSAAERAAATSPHFLFVGQIEEHKGVLQLAEAWERSGLRASRGATLAFVGEGTAFRALTDRVANVPGVAVLGRLTGTALTEQYDRASFVVVCSNIIENQPTVILEAFSRGVPAVGALSGGIPEMVREGETGFLFAVGDAAALANALERAAAFGDWVRLSANALSWAGAHGDAAHVAGLLSAYAYAGK